jgi:hypothetical protein
VDGAKSVVIVACIIVIAGCGGLNPLSGSDADGTQTPVSTVQSTGTLTEDEGAVDQENTFGPDTDTGDIVLRLSDLPENYEYSGETNRQTAELSGEEREQYESQGILRQHSRSFRRSDDSTGPVLVYSEATIYESADDVDAQIQEVRSTFESQSAEIETIELASGVTATQISYENDQGTQNVLVYYERDNLLLLIISSGQEQSYSERAQILMIQMISDIA